MDQYRVHKMMQMNKDRFDWACLIVYAVSRQCAQPLFVASKAYCQTAVQFVPQVAGQFHLLHTPHPAPVYRPATIAHLFPGNLSFSRPCAKARTGCRSFYMMVL